MNNREIARRVFSNEDPDDARKKVSNFIKAMRKKIEEAIWIS
jgi:predicted metalloendopeptidase